LHETILQEFGFRVPESITGCDVDELRRFTRDGPTISKAVCGTRAQTIEITEVDLEGFSPESGPIHLQRMVTGADAGFTLSATKSSLSVCPPIRSIIAVAG